MQHLCEVLEIPTTEVPTRLGEIPKDRIVGVFCSAGVRAVIIYTYLRANGYDNVKVLPERYPPLMGAIMPRKL